MPLESGRLIIRSNRAKCKLCGDIVESVAVHDFTTCKCGNLSVDGGLMYIKRCFKKPNSFIELSDFDPNPPKEEV